MTLGAMFTTLYSTSALAVLPTAAITESTDTATAQSTAAQNIESQSTESQSTEKQNLDTSAATPDTDSSIATPADSATAVDEPPIKVSHRLARLTSNQTLRVLVPTLPQINSSKPV